MPGSGAAASYGDLLITSLVVLMAVCIAAFVVVKLIGRFLATGRVRGAHLLDVIARIPLEPRRSLYVVEVAGKTLLVGTSEMGLSVLSELDAAEVKTRAVPPQSFADLVRGAWQKRKGLAHVAARSDGSKDVPAETRAGSKVRAEPRGIRGAHVGGDASSKDVPAETRGDAGSKDVPTETRAGSNVLAEPRGGSNALAEPRGSSSVPAEARAHVGGDASSKDVPAETRDVTRATARTDATA